MKLPLEGGLVEESGARLIVDLPDTPPELLPGLGKAVKDALVANGWSVVEVLQDDADRLMVTMRTDRAAPATVIVEVVQGRPQVLVDTR